MIAFRIFSLMLSAQIAWALSSVEDKFLNDELMYYFEDVSVDINEQIIAAAHQKREATEVSGDEQRFASLFAPINLTRSHHYWTRKRGREEDTTPPTAWDNYYGSFSTNSPFFTNFDYDDYRKKREMLDKIHDLNEDSSKKPVDVVPISITSSVDKEKPAKNLSEEVQDQIKKPQQNQPGDSPGKKFASRLNKCCENEADFPGFNQTLLTSKQQCLMETRKNRKSVNSSDDTIVGDGGLYNMFSADRINRWKTVVTCTLDCVGQKIGMFDSNAVINVDVAKRVVIENFARQQWEQDASNNLVEKCATELTSSSKAVDAFGFQCSSKAAEFVYCMWRELFLTCPIDKQQKSTQCEKLRAVLKQHNENKFRNEA